MHIRLLEDRDLPSLRVLRESARVVDSPWMHALTVDGLRGELRHGHDGEPPVCFLGSLDADGPVVAEGLMHLSDWDNHDLAWLDVTMHRTIGAWGWARRCGATSSSRRRGQGAPGSGRAPGRARPAATS